MKNVLLAILFFILSIVALYAYQNPVNYIDSVDVVQANVGNQKFTEWITANDADIDTLDNRTDILELEVDTLRLRVDSIQVSRDSVFYVYDAVGALSISPSSLDTITFDTEVREDAIFVHGADKGAVACNSAGWYNVVYSVGLRNSGGSALGTVYTYLIKYNAGWAVISGSYAYGTVSASVNSAEQLGAKVDIELVNGDSLAVIAYNGNAADVVVTIAETVRLRIEKLH